MSQVLDRALGILEHLATHPEGLPLAVIADTIDCPKSACHRLLVDLNLRGYVKQMHAQGEYTFEIGLAAVDHDMWKRRRTTSHDEWAAMSPSLLLLMEAIDREWERLTGVPV